ncbi:MAG: low molecular weight protein-tyrosine-phosphatase [Burkholderiales bacterium]|nr:low molecular weight protein-tyrosine-phosphatase [Burkholderiales bacterium]
MIKVLLVCMGNICRSPTAEGVFRAQVAAAGLAKHIHIDSAGTHDYHIGDPPDGRARAAAAKRGYDLSQLRGRQVGQHDFVKFDYILAMDMDNLTRMQARCPAEHAHKIGLFLEYSKNYLEREVPDPYYGGGAGFEKVLDMVEDAGQGLLAHLMREQTLK